MGLIGGFWLHMLLLIGAVAAKKKLGWIWPVKPENDEHVRNAVQFGVYLVAYAGLSTLRWFNLFSDRIQVAHSGYPPTLAFVFTAATFLCMLFACFTYHLDRYRIPLILPIVGIALVAAHYGSGDHVFQVTERKQEQVGLVLAEDILKPVNRRVILVAAEGGGIQAAGWTARVLGGLAEKEKGFAGAVRFISAVSGGAVGALFYMRSYPASVPEPATQWNAQTVFDAAVMSDLDPIAWGLLRYDLPPASWFRLDYQFHWSYEKDRGWALGESLAHRAGLEDVTLSQWALAVERGLPAIVFNATLAESGRPVLFSTIDLLKQGEEINFVLDRRQDVNVATAARLSAGFPFVSPPARPDRGDLVEHVVDGGYYDNSGLASVMAALRNTCGYRSCCETFGNRTRCNQENKPPRNRILVLRIRSFPSSKKPPQFPPTRSWVYDLWSPLDALFSVRTSSQRIRGESELRMLKNDLEFEEVPMEYQPPPGCSEPSLSWKLSEHEVGCLQRAWEGLAEKQKVSEFLNRPLVP